MTERKPAKRAPAKRTPAKTAKAPAKRAPAKRAPRKVAEPEPIVEVEVAPPPPPPAKQARTITIRLPSGFATIRDVLAFAAGMAIIVHEVFMSKTVDASAVAVGVSLTGLPLVFGADERRKSGGDKS